MSQLTRVRPLVGLEVRALGVDLLAARELALVYPALRVGRTVLVAPRVVPARAVRVVMVMAVGGDEARRPRRRARYL